MCQSVNSIVRELNLSVESEVILSEFLVHNEYLLPDRLSDHVDIRQYSKKLNRLGSSFVCIIDGKVCGVVTGYINDKVALQAHLQVLIVREDSQGLGIGHQLVRSFILASKKMGMKEVILTCDKSNNHAQHFYSREGFEKSVFQHPNPLKQYMIYRIVSD